MQPNVLKNLIYEYYKALGLIISKEIADNIAMDLILEYPKFTDISRADSIGYIEEYHIKKMICNLLKEQYNMTSKDQLMIIVDEINKLEFKNVYKILNDIIDSIKCIKSRLLSYNIKSPLISELSYRKKDKDGKCLYEAYTMNEANRELVVMINKTENIIKDDDLDYVLKSHCLLLLILSKNHTGLIEYFKHSVKNLPV